MEHTPTLIPEVPALLPFPESARITAYTDGSCPGPPGPGGWGVILIVDGETEPRKLSGAGPLEATNNRMEMAAVLAALQATPQGATLHVISDSQLIVNGLTKWLPAWKRRGWRKGDGKCVKNADMWAKIDDEASLRTVTAEWVPGHDGNRWNEEADRLAQEAIGA